ncbi:MAG: DUF2157 domain-containing protein [Actinomycetota bacterium]
MHPRTRIPPATHHPLHDLDGHLDLWSKEHLISTEQAGAIWAYEAYRVARPETERSETTPLTEALAYLGAGLAVAALAAILGRSWSDLATAVRIAIPAALAVVLFVVGWLTRHRADPAVARVSHVAWFLSTAAVAWFGAVLMIDGFGATGRWPLLVAGAAASVWAGELYLLRPSALQQVALLIGLAMLAGGLLFDSPAAAWSVIWALGVVWIVLGWRGVLTGRGTACTVGAIVAIVAGPAAASMVDPGLIWLAIVNAAALTAAAVALRQTPMLVLAAIGLFQGTVATTDHYLHGGIGAAVGLLVAGIVVLAIAFVASRRRRIPGPS